MLGRSFDVIVTAESNNGLSSQALFKQHADDAYFSNNKLEDWRGQIDSTLSPYFVFTISKKVDGILYSAYLEKTENKLFLDDTLYTEYKVSGDDVFPEALYSQTFPLIDGAELRDASGNIFDYDFILASETNDSLMITELADEFGNKQPFDFKSRFFNAADCALESQFGLGYAYGCITDDSLSRKR